MATLRFLRPFIVNKNDKSRGLTHTLLDSAMGGRVCLPDSEMNGFLVAYATDVKNNVPLYVNELRRDTFRMFLDLDIMHVTILTPSDILELTRVIFHCFKKFIPDPEPNQFMVIVSDAIPKCVCTDTRCLKALLEDSDKLDALCNPTLQSPNPIKISDAMNGAWTYDHNTIFELDDKRQFSNTQRVKGMVKHGIHMVYPHIIVTNKEALFMREALLVDLDLHFGSKFASEGWSHVVDNAVYVNSGLRMIYSNKTKNCDVCKNKNFGKNCTSCINGKDTTEGRPYTLNCVCVEDKLDVELTKTMQSNTLQLLHKAVIFTRQMYISHNWVKFDGCPSYGDIIQLRSNGAPKLSSKERVFNEEKKTTRTWKSKEIVVDQTIHQICLKHIQTRFVKQYKNTRIRSICRDDKRIYVSVDGEGSNFCINVNRDHNSNRIWFMFEMNGVSTRCFCTCLTKDGRNNGFCRDYSSPRKPINSKELSILFPNTNKHTNVHASLFQPPSQYIDAVNHIAKKGKFF